MTIELKPEQERILREALQQGRFRTVDEALAEAIRRIAPANSGKKTKGGLTSTDAAARLRELRKGNLLPPGTTLEELIQAGRA
jgi:Arc/MetJ-type ribon-helix-helix transcriptional regulator